MKNKIHKYISKKEDICCENDIGRKYIIQLIVKKYKNISTNMGPVGEHLDYDYLNYINNDLVKFIGYKVDLKKNKDVEGIKLWNKMDKLMYENKKVNLEKIEELLQSVPLYFLLSFLGYATYKEDLSMPL